MYGGFNGAFGGEGRMILKCENLTHIYGVGTPFQKTAINNINLEIQKGEFVGVIGHTGSGKSTLLQHLNGLLKPESGRVFVDGLDIWEKPENARKARFMVGLVFQYPEYQLFEETVYKDIAFGPKNMGLDEKEIDKRVKEAIDFVGLTKEFLEKSPFELSGGQKRRVAIAGVIAMEPKILILDEPTAGLDPKGRDDILSHIKTYHEEKKSTILLVSHSMEDIAKYSSKILVLKKGQKVMFDTVKNVFSRSEELEKMGLSVPQITKIFIKLKKHGIDADTGIYTIEDGKKEIVRLIKERQKEV